MPAQEIVYQFRDIFAPLVERRNGYSNKVNAVKQVFAKLLRANSGFQIAMRGCDNAYVNRYEFPATQALFQNRRLPTSREAQAGRSNHNLSGKDI